MNRLAWGLRPRKRTRFNGELVEINGVRLECSGMFIPGCKPSFNDFAGLDDPGEGSYIEDLKIRSLNDKQNIISIVSRDLIEKIESILINQVEEPSQEKED